MSSLDRAGAGSEEQKALCQIAEKHWETGRPELALGAAWVAHRLDLQNTAAKVLLAVLIGEFPAQVTPEMRPDILRLIQDRDVAPEYLSTAGWFLLMREPWWTAALNDHQCDALALQLDNDPLALASLHETPVLSREAERTLTRVRCWLVLCRQWPRYFRLLEALAAQAALNCGSWPFTDAEREALDSISAPLVLKAYLPARAGTTPSNAHPFADPLTRAVAQDYECWPYPPWRRIMAVNASLRLPDEIRALDPGGPDCLPVNANILIAGCGTGSEAAQLAAKYPDATITGIDLSDASLTYARERWRALGLRDVRFLKLDLHNVAELNQRFDAIFTSGVLHHLPDPERGWAKLAAILRPGGVMRIMLYSRMAHHWVTQARMLIQDLAGRPINDDLLRAVRRRFLERPNDPLTQQVINFSPFATLGGTRDLLLHRQDDCFDVPRIARALEHTRMRLLSFVLPDPIACARYNAMFPNDRAHRNVQSWAIFERHNPSVFIGQYDFWCRSNTFWASSNERRQ